MSPHSLNTFIVRAKAATYVGGVSSSRPILIFRPG